MNVGNYTVTPSRRCIFGWMNFKVLQKYRMRHRRVRHHEKGIEEVIRLFGEKAGQVARQHIISDLKKEGWTENAPFPKDEEHYMKMGLF
jgi:hypothetical protein